MSENDKEISVCIDEIKTNCRRYVWTVWITLGFKDFLENNIDDCRFVYAEKKLKVIENDEDANPDFILQYDDDNKGILGEIKSSITYNEQYLKRDLYRQINKYCKDIIGWETDDGKVLNHDLLCIFHVSDVGRVIRLVTESLDNVELIIDKNFSIAEFTETSSPKYGGGDIFLVKHEYGNLDCKELEQHLKDGLEFSIDLLTQEYEKIKFTRTRPPIEYIMELLWFNIFRIFAENPDTKEIVVTLEELLVQLYNYYISWSRIEGEYSQIRKSWIKDTMDMFVNIELAEIIEEVPMTYKVFIGKSGLPNDMLEYIYDESCKFKLKDSQTAKQEESQTKLNDYSKKH